MRTFHLLQHLSFSVFLVAACADDPYRVDPNSTRIELECDDEVDNDNNGDTDCEDVNCKNQPVCTDPEPEPEPPLEPEWLVCATIGGDRSTTPVDIVWVVDSSPSMVDEMGWIQQNLNDFVMYLTGIKLDVRVILLGGQDICAPEPLAGPNCSDGPKYRHINEYVGSTDSLEKVISFYPQYRNFLRTDGRKALIITTDDNSALDAQPFNEQLAALPFPGFGDDYVVHSIVSYGTHPRGCSTGSKPGTVYLELTEQTQGIKHPVCESDWSKVFEELGRGIVGMVDLPCAYQVPEMPTGKYFVDSQIHVTYAYASKRHVLEQVSGASACDELGWFYDPSAETVRLCPNTCKSIAVAEIEISFGCDDSVN